MKPSLRRALAVMQGHPLVPSSILSIAAELGEQEERVSVDNLTEDQKKIRELQELVVSLQMRILSMEEEPKLSDEQLVSIKRSVGERLKAYKWSELLLLYNNHYFQSLDARLRQPVAQVLLEHAVAVDEKPIMLWQNLALTGEP